MNEHDEIYSCLWLGKLAAAAKGYGFGRGVEECFSIIR